MRLPTAPPEDQPDGGTAQRASRGQHPQRDLREHGEGRDRRSGEQPIDGAGLRPAHPPTRKDEEAQDQRDEQEADPVDLRLDDEDHPIKGVERQRDRQRAADGPGRPPKLTRRRVVGRYGHAPFSR